MFMSSRHQGSCHQRTPGRHQAKSTGHQAKSTGHQAKFPRHQKFNKAVDKRTRNNLYVPLDLVGGELDQVESMWGRTRWR